MKLKDSNKGICFYKHMDFWNVFYEHFCVHIQWQIYREMKFRVVNFGLGHIDQFMKVLSWHLGSKVIPLRSLGSLTDILASGLKNHNWLRPCPTSSLKPPVTVLAKNISYQFLDEEEKERKKKKMKKYSVNFIKKTKTRKICNSGNNCSLTF